MQNIQDLHIGTKVMGLDGNARIVRAIRTIEEPCYEIRPLKGKPFLMGHQQELELIRYGAYLPTEYTSMVVSDFIEKSDRWKHLHRLYRVPISFKRSQPLPLCPYFLGLLLGGACFRRNPPVLITYEPEIINYIHEIAPQLGVRITINQLLCVEANHYSFSYRSGTQNPLTNILKKLDLYNKFSSEKFVPHLYKKANKRDRQKILAGLLDRVAYLRDKMFIFICASKQLAEDIIFLAQSLGLYGTERHRDINGTTYYQVHISGDFTSIPLKVKRKTPGPRLQKSTHLRTRFTVHEYGIQPCTYLFLEGEDSTYIKEDFMVMEGVHYDEL